MKSIFLEMPWSPSVNGYWRSFNNRQILSKRARQYRIDAMVAINKQLPKHQVITCRVKVRMDLYPPTLRNYDADNFTKAVFDALSHNNVWLDDEQVYDLRIVKKNKVKGGKINVLISECCDLIFSKPSTEELNKPMPVPHENLDDLPEMMKHQAG